MGSERPHPESVSVEISGCSKDDARIVFDALCACFTSDRCSDDVPQDFSETRPTVWLGTFDVSEARQGARPSARLAASVDADVHGGYWAIDRFRTTLDSLFTVHELSTVPGDQEEELHVRLESR
ncbi:MULTISPECIES: hypothetical protein [Streptomyces]|jgi:hypothetical protein|uniref:Uncharacterized protein n=2 Tax=Streptomyces TaxID=1883 RepID=A0AA40S885_9ACTN|nr:MULTISPECIES: hypothetical protein [Streptomyces]MBA8941744.1 hypothetical protein [Streptomyces calvus]MBA8976323.1 hypothetical protein [Streptomyces calvus]MYS30569.1 hypothetical protein [Streptomyces sp. SID7804]GGP62073.1 hypothetical protein GCM10010247_38490 [Streptomyces calvus]